MLPMSNREVKRIKDYIKQHGIKEQRHNFATAVDMTCPFRDTINRKCLIYDVRPTICSQFMCNHELEDIMKAKFNLHEINQVVFMRHEFYGNDEDVAFIRKLIEGGD